MLSKTNTFNFYRKKSLNNFFWWKFWFFEGFWIKFGSKKLVFGLTSKNIFFSMQYLNILQTIKTVVDNMCVLFYKKSRNGWKSIFHECDGKIIKHFTKKKVLGCSKVLFLAFLNTLKLFFGKMFYYFFVTFMKNAFATISWFFIKQNAHVVNNSFFNKL